MDKTLYVTVTGINHYFGQKPFEPGRVMKFFLSPEAKGRILIHRYVV